MRMTAPSRSLGIGRSSSAGIFSRSILRAHDMENSNKKDDGAETDKPAVSPETVPAPVVVGASVTESTPASADAAIDGVAPADVKIAKDDKAETAPREAVQADGVEDADGAVRAALKELL